MPVTTSPAGSDSSSRCVARANWLRAADDAYRAAASVRMPEETEACAVRSAGRADGTNGRSARRSLPPLTKRQPPARSACRAASGEGPADDLLRRPQESDTRAARSDSRPAGMKGCAHRMKGCTDRMKGCTARTARRTAESEARTAGSGCRTAECDARTACSAGCGGRVNRSAGRTDRCAGGSDHRTARMNASTHLMIVALS